MKNIFISILLLAGTALTAPGTAYAIPAETAPAASLAASESPIVATAYYKLSDPEFTFSYDFQEKITNFNIPFASHFYISGKHLEFTISQEEFEWRLVRNNPNSYYDFYIDFGTNGMSRTGILRVYFQ